MTRDSSHRIVSRADVIPPPKILLKFSQASVAMPKSFSYMQSMISSEFVICHITSARKPSCLHFTCHTLTHFCLFLAAARNLRHLHIISSHFIAKAASTLHECFLFLHPLQGDCFYEKFSPFSPHRLSSLKSNPGILFFRDYDVDLSRFLPYTHVTRYAGW